MTTQSDVGEHPSVPTLAPARPRRRGRRGGRKHQARRLRAAHAAAAPVQHRTAPHPLGITPATDEALRFALEVLAEHRALRGLADVCQTFETLTPDAVLLTRAAQAACALREETLDRLGLKPQPLEIEDRVTINGRVYRLPDRTTAALAEVHDLVLAMANASQTEQEEAMAHTQHTTGHPHPEDMNGTQPLEDPGFFGRAWNTVRAHLPTLRMPTATEAAIGLAVVVVGTGIYLAVTGGESPTEAA